MSAAALTSAPIRIRVAASTLRFRPSNPAQQEPPGSHATSSTAARKAVDKASTASSVQASTADTSISANKYSSLPGPSIRTGWTCSHYVSWQYGTGWRSGAKDIPVPLRVLPATSCQGQRLRLSYDRQHRQHQWQTQRAQLRPRAPKEQAPLQQGCLRYIYPHRI